MSAAIDAPPLALPESARGQSRVIVDSITKRYPATVALDRLSFELRAGETVALLGPNGAGKSTLVDLMLGLRLPSSGSVEVLGGEPRSAVEAGRVGAVLQRGALPAGAKVIDVVRLACGLYRRRAVDEVLGLSELSELASRRVERLSGGQAQRVRFAMALAGRPALLFLDEPTVGLDPQARRQFWSGVRMEAQHGTTVLFATHYLEEVEQHADRALVLDAGRIVADDTPERIKAGVCATIIRARLAGAPEHVLRGLRGVISVERQDETVTIRSSDSDATAEALFAAGLHPRDLRIAAGGLEDALLALTRTHTTEPHEEDHR